MSAPNDHEAVEILGIGAPFIDYIVPLSNESALEQLPGQKGGMTVVDYQTFAKLFDSLRTKIHPRLGGSATNAIKGLVQLGHPCGLIGKVGTDPAGEEAVAALKQEGVIPYLHSSDTPTGRCLSFVTLNERTMLSYLGASQEMTPEELDPALFTGVKLVHIEGYTLARPGLTERAMQLAKEAGARVSFDLGSFEMVEAHKEVLTRLLANYVDILFGNTLEVRALTQLDPEEGCRVLRDLSGIVVVLMGKEGCIVGKGQEQFYCPVRKVNAIDVTGAGDLFASGFLHSLLQGKSMEKCAQAGNLIASTVTEVFGTDIPPDQWKWLKEQLLN